MANESQEQKSQRNWKRKEEIIIWKEREGIWTTRKASKIYWRNLIMQCFNFISQHNQGRLE